MFNALTVVVLLGQMGPGPGCATCGGRQGATGGFPLDCQTAWERVWNFCSGEILGFGRAKCPCPLGTAVPCGDSWAMQMHGGFAVTAPMVAPAPAPSTGAPPPPTAPEGTPPRGGAAPAPAPGPGAAQPPGSTLPALPTPPPGGALTPLP